MPRIAGARNITPLTQRNEIDTTSRQQIEHLTSHLGCPWLEFDKLLSHQSNYLNWLDKRYEKNRELQAEVDRLSGLPLRRGPRGAREGTYIKYRWYAEHLVLLETINAFENFYKKTFVRLGNILQDFIDPVSFPRELAVDPRLIWNIGGKATAAALMFESKLFHNLNTVDECSKMLIGQKRYNAGNPGAPMRERVNALNCIFQIRHTMSHNNGLVTDSDRVKFVRLGMSATTGEIIDLTKNKLGIAILKELKSEAWDFTIWLSDKTARHLQTQVANTGVVIPVTVRSQLEGLLLPGTVWDAVGWTV
jgi:hypothetical protein